MASGVHLTHRKYGNKTPWNIKAEIAKKLYMCFIKRFKQYRKPVIGRAMTILQPFTRKTYPGLRRRPKLMMGVHADAAIILNLLTFLSEGSAGTAVASKPGSLNHILSYKHIRAPPVIIDPCVRHLEDIIIARMAPKKRFRLHGKQKVRH